jgi:hypothetical protein
MLTDLSRLPRLHPFYLADGTALALRLGHRISQDLDLFANVETFDDQRRLEIVNYFQAGHSVERLQDSPLGLVLKVDGLAVNFSPYGYPLLDSTDEVSGVPVAGLRDIGLMKLDAIAGRGTRKDFYDIYFIAQHVSLDELFARSADKYPQTRGFEMRVLTALVDFAIAQQQEEPMLVTAVEWEQVKAFCRAEARRLGEEWFGES